MNVRRSQRSPRKQAYLRAVLAAAIALHSREARATCLVHPWTEFGSRLARIAEPTSLALLAGAGVAPLVLAPTGVDQSARVFFQRDLGGTYDAESVSTTAPYALAASVVVAYGASLLADDCAASTLSSHAIAAIGTSFVVMGALKFVVGRTYPAAYVAPGEDRLVDDGRSRQIQAFSEFGAWPSGHATATFAFAAVLRKELASRHFFLRYSGYALAAAVSFAMAYGDHHWTSDLISGALLGESFGRAFGGPLENSIGVTKQPKNSGIVLIPTGTGVALTGVF